MNLTQKAVRAVIELGSIELDCYQMPDGSYSYGIEYLAKLIDKDKTILSDKKSPYLLKTLLGEDKTSQTVKIDGIGYTYKSISQSQFGKALGSLARLGHSKAVAILEATFEEALERRADIAHQKVRTEQEYNERLDERQNHREDFHPKFTDWLKSDGCEGAWYGAEVNNLKRILSLPIISVDLYDAKQLRKLDVAYIKYDVLRTTGMTHQAALKVI